jgi:sRNA-binding carbon storage regulator CsrA
MALVLARQAGESVELVGFGRIELVRIGQGGVRLAFHGFHGVEIVRSEILDEADRFEALEQRLAARSSTKLER